MSCFFDCSADFRNSPLKMQIPEIRARSTQRDIAKALGVSHSTVSLALRDSPKLTPTRRLQIQEAAQKMGYQPNPVAAALSHFKRTSSITPIRAALAWLNLWPRPAELRKLREFDCYWRGANAAAEKLGYHLEEFSSADFNSSSHLEKILFARGINGILLPPQRDGPDFAPFQWDRFSAVRFGRSVQKPRVHLVTANQVSNAVIAFNRATELGYKRIGFVLGHTRALFQAGFLMAQQRLDEPSRVPVYRADEANPASTIYGIARWIRKYKPDAILTDIKVLIDLVRKSGYRVPEDIGVAAMSILDGGADAGIDQQPEEIGRVGLLVLTSLINDNARGVPPIFREILVEGSWVDGSSLPPR